MCAVCLYVTQSSRSTLTIPLLLLLLLVLTVIKSLDGTACRLQRQTRRKVRRGLEKVRSGEDKEKRLREGDER